jgi:hypothetical protein
VGGGKLGRLEDRRGQAFDRPGEAAQKADLDLGAGTGGAGDEGGQACGRGKRPDVERILFDPP